MKNLVVLIGPTAVGKTDLSFELARWLGSPVISADSRQLFKEMSIGTAVPSPTQLNEVPHYFIQNKSIHHYYSSYEYEKEVIAFLSHFFETRENALLTGGSMLYIDAVCNGIDYIPPIPDSIRQEVVSQYETHGIEWLQIQLKEQDPVFYEEVDLQNPKRMLHAVEICISSGQPYSSFRKNTPKKRPFAIHKIGLEREREELYERINQRVDLMIAEGLVEEARKLYPYKGLTPLKTVGYKELFEHFDGQISLDKAVELIKRNSRHYAKRQITWFRKDSSIKWFHPEDATSINSHLKKSLKME